MVGRTTTEKTRAAVRLLLNDAAVRRNRSRAVWIGWAKNGNDREADSGGDMHSTGVVADEKMALRQQCRQIGNPSFPGEVNWRPAHFGSDCRRDGRLGSGPKEDYIGTSFPLQAIRHIRKTRRRPALRRSVRSASSDCSPQRALANAVFAKKFIGTLPPCF